MNIAEQLRNAPDRDEAARIKKDYFAMGLIKFAALAGLGYAGARWFMSKRTEQNAAYASDQPQQGHTSVRDSGPAAMRDTSERDWSGIDEASDQSFPASDPPATY